MTMGNQSAANGWNLAEKTAYELSRNIGEGKRFPPGSKLPNENELSVELGVSRTTLREAIRILNAQGVLVVRRGIGTYICDDIIKPDNDFGMLGYAKSRLIDLFEMRMLFEPGAAALACERATDKEIQEIIRKGEVVRDAILNNEDRTEADQEFHREIVAAAGNEFIIDFYPIVERAIQETIIAVRTHPTFAQYTLNDHDLIMQYFTSRDPEGVAVAMRLHVRHAIDALIEATKSGDSDELFSDKKV